jgi:hypothetical protein
MELVRFVAIDPVTVGTFLFLGLRSSGGKAIVQTKLAEPRGQSPASYLSTHLHALKLSFLRRGAIYVRFQGVTAVTMKNGVFWDVTPCGSCKNRRFGGT